MGYNHTGSGPMDEKTIHVSVQPIACGLFVAYSPIGHSDPQHTAVEAMKSWVQKYVSKESVKQGSPCV